MCKLLFSFSLSVFASLTFSLFAFSFLCYVPPPVPSGFYCVRPLQTTFDFQHNKYLRGIKDKTGSLGICCVCVFKLASSCSGGGKKSLWTLSICDVLYVSSAGYFNTVVNIYPHAVHACVLLRSAQQEDVPRNTSSVLKFCFLILTF